MTEATDLDLLHAHVDGDSAAFSLLVGRHERWIFDAARRRLRDDHLADDARQAVFLLLSQRAAQLTRAETVSLPAWLFHVTHFTCLGIRRTRSRQTHHEAAAGELTGARHDADDDRLALLEDAIADLPPRDREAVVRRFYQRETFADVGRALGITEEAARKRVTRVLSRCRAALSLEGVEALPPVLLKSDAGTEAMPRAPTSEAHQTRIESLARGTITMVEQAESMRFAVMTAEFYVRSVEEHLEFFEKLGFRRHYVQEPGADGRSPKASLRGGHARIWLRKATPEHPPTPGVIVYVWLDGGEDAVIRHREAIAAQGVAVNQFYYDGALMNFTVNTPDGYTIGFFSTYKPHTFDVALDG